VPTRAESWRTLVILSHSRRSGCGSCGVHRGQEQGGCSGEEGGKEREDRKGAPFPAPVRLLFTPLTLRSFAGHSGSTQGQLKLTAIYCISIMVSHLPLRGSPASRASYCTIAAAPSPVSPPHSTRATRELGLHSRFTTSFMVHTVREHAEVPYGQLSPARLPWQLYYSP